MANPIFPKGVSGFLKRASLSRLNYSAYHLPLSARRCGAWVIEFSFIAVSALIPFKLGLLVDLQFTGEPVPLNSALQAVDAVSAHALSSSDRRQVREVAPLTNLLWLGALVAPAAVGAWQIYLLGKTGRTLPKAWLAVQVVTAKGTPPGIGRALVREVLGRWGCAVAIAYLLGLGIGAGFSLGTLAAVIGLLLLGEGATLLSDRQQRALHDRLAGTHVLDGAVWSSSWKAAEVSPATQAALLGEPSDAWSDENGAIAAIVLAPEVRQQGSLWQWMRQYPGTTIVVGGATAAVLLLGTFVGTQIYIQHQADRRQLEQQKNQVFLALVNQLTTLPQTGKQRAAILALATINDSRVTPLLTDLLAQETEPALTATFEQALVTRGLQTLPSLHKLNQVMAAEFASLQASRSPAEYQAAALRRRATQRAIAKILSLYSGQLASVNLNQIDLAQRSKAPAAFTLALEKADLSGIRLRGALLVGAHLQASSWSSPGADQRWGTRDDRLADLGGADLKSADLSEAFLQFVGLERANLTNAILNEANLTGAQLTQANLSSASLINANLPETVLRQASMTGANLSRANLVEADLSDALLGQAVAVGARLESTNLTRTDWRGADLSRAELQRANLREADLSTAQLTHANLENAQLQNANLQNADLTEANLSGANLKGADLKGARFVPPSRVSPGQFIEVDPDYEAAQLLQGVDFSRVRNLDAEQLDYICLQGGIHPKCKLR